MANKSNNAREDYPNTPYSVTLRGGPHEGDHIEVDKIRAVGEYEYLLAFKDGFVYALENDGYDKGYIEAAWADTPQGENMAYIEEWIDEQDRSNRRYRDEREDAAQ